MKIVVLIFFAALFIFGGMVTGGMGVLSGGAPLALSNTEMLMNFLCGGWAFVWRAFLGILTTMGIIKLFKWWLLK